MELSIIIVNYNTGKLVKTCLEKILKDTKDLTAPNSEIIIVDNCSTIDPIDESWIPVTKNVTLIKNRENIGYSKANNQALRIARGKHYLLLNSDT
ncbi:MAG: glycosyltransferase, partial [bacterium]|nr:glycosyltransferase [bacterium]